MTVPDVQNVPNVADVFVYHTAFFVALILIILVNLSL
jgi:hypothetical protein